MGYQREGSASASARIPVRYLLDLDRLDPVGDQDRCGPPGGRWRDRSENEGLAKFEASWDHLAAELSSALTESRR
ncbi:hypothetical protein C8258_21105 [Nocardia sp. MDA0666]|nr:hypothetical protein C8258_21105 [Nocardia sp. MDA0666]